VLQKNVNSNISSSENIFVDLDGTLIKTDILVESILLLIKKNLFFVFLLPLWLLKGKAYFKQRIAECVNIDVSRLPYHEEFLEHLHRNFNSRNRLFLATASNIKVAKQVADHIGIFESVIASDANINMSGSKKLIEIQKITKGEPFVYAGNSKVDIAIWKYANSCIIVNACGNVEKIVKSRFLVSHTFVGSEKKITLWLKAIRIHQWLKNILLFVSLFAAHQITNITLLSQSFLGFVSFSLCASSVYLLNDLLDLPSDRCHPTKKNRPFAAGNLPLNHGIVLVPILLFFSFSLTYFLPTEFLVILVFYYCLTLSYSLYLKQLVLIDVMVLTCLYVIRVIAGSAATGIPSSFWLIAFAMFIFFSLALVKRASELITLKVLNKGDVAGRGYLISDLEYLHSMGVASGYISALILALYINSDKVIGMYKTPEILWLTFPLVLYWISRIWLKTGRGEVQEDPLLFAFKDQQSLLAGSLFVIVMIFAAIFRF